MIKDVYYLYSLMVIQIFSLIRYLFKSLVYLFIFLSLLIKLEEFFLFSNSLSYICIMNIFFQWLTFSIS